MPGNTYGLLIISEIIYGHFRLFQVAKSNYLCVYIMHFCFVSITYLALDIFLFLYLLSTFSVFYELVTI